jgi:thiol-disulfide isomerase/thioredoxin
MNYFYIGLITLFLGVGLYYVRSFYSKWMKGDKNKFLENKEYNRHESNNIVGDVYFFYTTWCPHSKKSMKIYDEIKKSYHNPDFKLNFLTIDAEKKKDMASKYDVKNYPTIVVDYNGKKFHYDANLNTETFDKFLKYVYNA